MKPEFTLHQRLALRTLLGLPMEYVYYKAGVRLRQVLNNRSYIFFSKEKYYYYYYRNFHRPDINLVEYLVAIQF